MKHTEGGMQSVEKWGVFQVELKGPAEGNPFVDVELSAEFTGPGGSVNAAGFYDGDGTYRIRFMPPAEGKWTYRTASNSPALADRTGEFLVTAPGKDNHGPVRVDGTFHFAYADGTRYWPIGTTCYAWINQGPELIGQTLETLAAAPFNKLRMCVFPKHYSYNRNEPPEHAFPLAGPKPPNPGESTPADWRWDFTRFNVSFFQNLDRCVEALGRLGIEADVILFHPYDCWGFANLDAETERRYLRYVIARLSAYRNVWWSLANEWDFMKHKTAEDFTRFLGIVAEADPYGHLCSAHNGAKWFDWADPRVTHVSYQGSPNKVTQLREEFSKPVVVDECCYEGNCYERFGDLTAKEMVSRIWDTLVRGGYLGHGECYEHPQDILWWSKGGKLYGQSPERIAFIRRLLQEAPTDPLQPCKCPRAATLGLCKPGEYYLFRIDCNRQPIHRWIDLEGGPYKAEILDLWNMTIEPVEGTWSGSFLLPLPGRDFIGIRFTRVKNASA